MDLKSQLLREEGAESCAYQDSLGFWTIGVGRLIDSRKGGGLSNEEIDFLLENDIKRNYEAVLAALPSTRTASSWATSLRQLSVPAVRATRSNGRRFSMSP